MTDQEHIKSLEAEITELTKIIVKRRKKLNELYAKIPYKNSYSQRGNYVDAHGDIVEVQ